MLTEADSLTGNDCKDCNKIKENYEKILQDEKKKLITFKGHGKKPKYHCDPFTEDDFKQLLKLILIGVKKVHFTVPKNEPVVDVALDGARIECQIKEDPVGFVKKQFHQNIKVKIVCDVKDIFPIRLQI